MILLIDNFDSFTYNIYQYLRKLGYEVTVQRNNALTIEDINQLQPSHYYLTRARQAGGSGNKSGNYPAIKRKNSYSRHLPWPSVY